MDQDRCLASLVVPLLHPTQDGFDQVFVICVCLHHHPDVRNERIIMATLPSTYTVEDDLSFLCKVVDFVQILVRADGSRYPEVGLEDTRFFGTADENRDVEGTCARMIEETSEHTTADVSYKPY